MNPTHPCWPFSEGQTPRPIIRVGFSHLVLMRPVYCSCFAAYYYYYYYCAARSQSTMARMARMARIPLYFDIWCAGAVVEHVQRDIKW